MAHVIGAHILSRARHGVTGRIDLAPTPGGLGTLAFGPEHRVIRLGGATLIVESTWQRASTSVLAVNAASLRSLAAHVGVDLEAEFSAGPETPPLGDVDAPLHLDDESVRALGAWFALGEEVIDEVGALSGPSADPTRARLWPEHFDLGIDVAAGGSRVNLGASPGDNFHGAPYLYVSPWESDRRPGAPDYWNAPFGAVLGYDELLTARDPRSLGVHFMRDGLSRLSR